MLREQQGCGEGSRGPGKSGWLKDSDDPESARGGGSVRICRASLNGQTPKAAPSSHKSYAKVQETPQEGESPAQAWSQVGEERLPGPRTQCQAKGPWSSLRSFRQVVSPFLVEEFPFRGKDGSVSPVETELGQLLRLQLGVVNLGSALGCRPDLQEKMVLSSVNSTSPACTDSPKPSRYTGAGFVESGKEAGALPLGEWGAGGTAPRVYGCFRVPEFRVQLMYTRWKSWAPKAALHLGHFLWRAS